MSEKDTEIIDKDDIEEITVESKKPTDDNDEYEKVCFVCHRPESTAGKMVDLPNNISVCSSCMQKSFDAMSSGQIDYSQLMNIPGIQVLNLADAEKSIPKNKRLKRKKKLQVNRLSLTSKIFHHPIK